ncbi:HAMP domain-containing histidine kinase [Ktedonobacteria bacterium brp13]|nr:HAMP domain-containing histidine kinase [Ktedonobacteria bacterium brp13]
MQLQRGEESIEESIQQSETITRDLQRQIDELKAENLQLHEQLASKEQFTAMIAHDLRGPLSPIINYAQMIARHARLLVEGKEISAQQTARKGSAIQRNTSIIISQAQRMSRLVNDLLDTSHISTGTFHLHQEEADLVKLVKDMVEQLRPVAPYHKLVVVAPRKAIRGSWDAGRLQQALGNLLDNAIKYSDEHTVVTVTVAKEQDTVRVSVNNQGATISSSEVGSLFRPYSRLQNASTHQGSGLGLYITKSIIEAHKGVLRLEKIADEESTDQPRGTTFTFELPL